MTNYPPPTPNYDPPFLGPDNLTLAQRVPKRVRDWGYAVSGVVVTGYFAYDLAYTAPKWMSIPLAMLSASGFYVAKKNVS